MRRSGVIRTLTVLAALAVACAACSTSDGTSDPSASGSGDGAPATPAETCVDSTGTADDPDAPAIVAAAEQVLADQDLRALVVRVERDGEEVVTVARGEALPGVAATADMHFWNGAMVFSYLGTVLLQLDDEGVLDVDAPIADLLADVPGADQITPRMLVTNTSGLVDYVPMPDWLDQLYADPFRPFTQDELEGYVFDEPLLFEPGTNVSYTHMGFRLAGEVISAATGQPLDEVLVERIVEPLGLSGTEIPTAADLPQPFLRTFSDERGNWEDTSTWSPAWGVPDGATMATTVCDVAVAGAAVGSGELISQDAYATFVDAGTVGVPGPSDDCPSCIPMSEQLNFGFGTINAGDWIVQTPLFTGIAGVQAYLPSEDLSIAIANTWADGGDIDLNGSVTLLQELAPILAPDATPPMLQS